MGHFRKGGACCNGMSRILGKTVGVLGKKLADLIRGVACRDKGCGLSGKGMVCCEKGSETL